MRTKLTRMFTLGVGFVVYSCGSDTSGTSSPTRSATGGSVANSTGGSAMGGAEPGGINTSGSATAGLPSGGTPTSGFNTGGVGTGGAQTGSSATGGAAMGGTPAGGMDMGGAQAGGASAGGAVTGGAQTGGAASGGAATGGAETGGASTGGAATGGTETGGASTGGAATGGTTEDASAAIVKDGESLITQSGVTIVSYGGYLNGESFQQDAIVTHADYQYAAFWNTSRHVVVARRQLPEGVWETVELTDYTNAADDAHNTISLGVCPSDGTLHLAFDHHGNDLHYRQSVPEVVTSPAAATWAASSFTAVTSALEGSTTVAQVTYPRFVTEPGGDRLLLAARIGGSGSGDEFLWEYDGNSQAWTPLGRFIDGITDSVNAYLHGLAYTRGGSRLHIAWCWRETPEANTNHDLLYAYSDDHGRTWQNNTGELLATAGSTFITRDSSSAVVWAIGQNRGLINQEHMVVDNDGRVHVLLSHMSDAQADDADFTSARNKSEFFHYWRDTDGTWRRNGLGLPVIANFRGSLAVSSTNSVYAVLPDLRIAGASSAADYGDWALLDSTDSGRFFSDPLVDTLRLETEDKLTIYYPEASSMNIWALQYTLE